MVLNFGVFGGNPIYDSAGSMLVNTGNNIESTVIFSLYPNGVTCSEGGSYLGVVDKNTSTSASVNNTSVSDVGWGLRADFGRIVKLSKLYTYYGMTTPAGRWGRCNVYVSSDGTTWTLVKTGTDTQSTTQYDQYDAANVTCRYVKWVYAQTATVLNVPVTLFPIELIAVKGD